MIHFTYYFLIFSHWSPRIPKSEVTYRFPLFHIGTCFAVDGLFFLFFELVNFKVWHCTLDFIFSRRENLRVQRDNQLNESSAILLFLFVPVFQNDYMVKVKYIISRDKIGKSINIFFYLYQCEFFLKFINKVVCDFRIVYLYLEIWST